MKRLIAIVVVWVAMSGNAFAQGQRHQIYGYYYNGYTLEPGLSIYDGPGHYYSYDYPVGRVWRHEGYKPVPRHNPGRYNGYNGLIAPQPWMFDYPSNYLTPYNIYSPIWR